MWLGKAAEKILLWGDPPSRTSWDFRVPQALSLPEEPARSPAQPQQDHQVVEEVRQLQPQAQPVNQEVEEVPQLQPQPQPEHLNEVPQPVVEEVPQLQPQPQTEHLDEVPQPHLPPPKRKRQTKKGGRDCAGML